MNKSLRAILSLGWQSFVYGFGAIGSRVVIYLLLPILTHRLPREEYGAISVIMSGYAFLNMLTFAGQRTATFRFYNEYQDEANKRLVIGTSQFLFFALAGIPAAIIIAFPNSASIFLLGSTQYTLAIQFAACFLVVDSMNAFGSAILRIQIRPLVSSIHSILLIAFETGMAILFVAVYDMGVAGYWLGYFIGAAIGLLVMVWLVRSAISFKVSWKIGVELLRFGIPLIPAGLSLTALRLADRYFIGSMAGLDQVAIYDVGYRIGALVSLTISPFQTAWSPFAFSIAHKPEARRIFRDVLTYLTAGTAFLTLVIIAFRKNLLQIMAPASYTSADHVVIWVAVSQIFLAVYTVLAMGPMIAKRTRSLAWVGILAGALNLLLNFLLIPPMGIRGAAIATFVGYLMLALLTYFIAQRFFPIAVDWRRMAQLLLICGIVSLCTFMIEGLLMATWLEITAKMLSLMAFPVLLLLLGFINKEQGLNLIEMGRNRFFKKTARTRNDLLE